MNLPSAFVLSFANALIAVATLTATAEDRPLTRIALGSCARQNQPQPIWDPIVAAKPDLFLFLGDNIYGDSRDMNVLRDKYFQLAAIIGFQKLHETCPILAIWDDHDYGADDAGAEYPMKVESQKLFLDFFKEPLDSPRRQQKGIHDAKVFGPVGQRVQIILLDT
jgi:alkaline phosphatase D